MSAAQIAEYINDKYGTTINKRSIQRYVKEGRAGESPDRMGPDGGVSRAIFPILAWSFQSYVKINQLNASISKIL